MMKKPLPLLALIVGFCAVVVLIVVLVKALYTPVVDQPVVNDTSQKIVISGCSSDPGTFAPGESGTIQVSKDKKDACDVQQIESGKKSCIVLPGGSNPSTIYISKARSGSC